MLFTFEFGLFFWSAIIWIVVLTLLRIYAWKPLLAFMQEQEHSYAQAAKNAEEQRKIAHTLEKESKTILQKADREKEKILQEGLAIKKSLLKQAELEAMAMRKKILDQAQKDMLQEKQAMIKALKEQIGLLSIHLAEKLLQKELSEKNKQEMLLQTLIKQAGSSHQNVS